MTRSIIQFTCEGGAGRSDTVLSSSSPLPCPLSLKYDPLPEAPHRLHRSVNLNQLDKCALSEMTSAALWQCRSQPLISVGWRLFTAVSSFTSHLHKRPENHPGGGSEQALSD